MSIYLFLLNFLSYKNPKKKKNVSIYLFLQSYLSKENEDKTVSFIREGVMIKILMKEVITN